VDDRRGLEGILWSLWSGCPWRELPRRYARASTCWRRLQPWEERGLVRTRWRAFWAPRNDQAQRRWAAGCVEGRFVPATTGGPQSGTRHVARGPRGGCWSRARGLRWEPSLEAASPAAVTRLEQPRDTVAVGRPGTPGRPRTRPERLLADRGDDRTPLRARLARRGSEPSIPARRHHQKAPHPDGRKVRRGRRRWMVERTFAW
jgi:putative transposase of IS4/5 family DUF4096